VAAPQAMENHLQWLGTQGMSVGMFGMLDYRAYKLAYILWLPLQIISKISLFVVISISIFITQLTSFNTVMKIIAAYIVFEIIAIIVFQVFWSLVYWAFKRAFLWIIDVVPAHGANIDEAKAIALGGRRAELLIKLEKDIQNWTREDTSELVTFMNWRARLFFGEKIRIRAQRTATALKQTYNDNGRQPIDLGISGINKARIDAGGKASWFESAIVSQPFFN
jgi:hypothetical protein